MLATNQQGQTYLVAQPQPPPVNQILLTQTSQQQGGAPTKTIIILQQQTPTTVNTGMYCAWCMTKRNKTKYLIWFKTLKEKIILSMFLHTRNSECTTKSDHDHTARAANDCDTSTTTTSCHCKSTFRKWLVFQMLCSR